MGLYWKVIGYGSIVGTLLAIGVLVGYYQVFALEPGLETVADSVKWGVVIGLVTSLMATIGTLPTASHLRSGKGKAAFVALASLSPLAGWLLLAALSGAVEGWNFAFFALVAGISSVAIAIGAAVATLFMPAEVPGEGDDDDVAVALRSFSDTSPS